MDKQRLQELAGVQLNESPSKSVIKCESGDYIRADGYDETDDINRAKVFANIGSAKRYITSKLSHKKCKAVEVIVTIDEK